MDLFVFSDWFIMSSAPEHMPAFIRSTPFIILVPFFLSPFFFGSLLSLSPSVHVRS